MSCPNNRLNTIPAHNNSMQRMSLRAAVDAERYKFPSYSIINGA
jgi:hypothetical protein